MNLLAKLTPLGHRVFAPILLSIALCVPVRAMADDVADEPPPPTVPSFVHRPIAIGFEGGMGAPTGFFGMTLGYTLPHQPWVVEVGGGLGSTGMQIAAQAKYYMPILGSTRHSLTLQAGPSLGLIGKPVGFAVPHKDGILVGDSDLYYVLWLHAGVGWEVRWHWGGFVRVALGAMLNVANNQEPLCRNVDTIAVDAPGAGSCGSMHIALGPEVARRLVLPWLSFAYGWSF